MKKLNCILMMSAIGIAAAGYEIRLPREPTATEQLAHDELRHYLDQCAEEITIEGVPAVIHIGESDFARAEGQTRDKFEDEEWMVVNFDRNIVIQGGDRGVLWAAYHFLEDQIGVSWLSPVAEHIPAWRRFEFPELDNGGQPALKCRCSCSFQDQRQIDFQRRNRGTGSMAACATVNHYIPGPGSAEFRQEEKLPQAAVHPFLCGCGNPYPDIADLQRWLELKYFEDPERRDLDALRERFMAEYFGSAAPAMEKYRELIRRDAEKNHAEVRSFGDESGVRHPDLATVLEAQELFEEAGRLLGYNGDHFVHVAWARMQLDMVTGYLLPRYYYNLWQAAERELELLRPEQFSSHLAPFPLSPEKARERTKGVWNHLANLGRLEVAQTQYEDFSRYEKLPDQIPAPLLFEGRNFLDITPELFGWNAIAEVVMDPSADTGYVYKMALPEDAEEPFVFVLNDPKSDRELLRTEIASSDLAEDGVFQWYRLSSRFKPGSRCILEWLGTPFRVGLSDLEAFAGNRSLELWVRFKLRGGASPAALVERVVAVRHYLPTP